jgi:hypothetical protein
MRSTLGCTGTDALSSLPPAHGPRASVSGFSGLHFRFSLPRSQAIRGDYFFDLASHMSLLNVVNMASFYCVCMGYVTCMHTYSCTVYVQ